MWNFMLARVNQLLLLREMSRKAKDWSTADAYREQLRAAGK